LEALFSSFFFILYKSFIFKKETRCLLQILLNGKSRPPSFQHSLETFSFVFVFFLELIYHYLAKREQKSNKLVVCVCSVKAELNGFI